MSQRNKATASTSLWLWPSITLCLCVSLQSPSSRWAAFALVICQSYLSSCPVPLLSVSVILLSLSSHPQWMNKYHCWRWRMLQHQKITIVNMQESPFYSIHVNETPSCLLCFFFSFSLSLFLFFHVYPMSHVVNSCGYPGSPGHASVTFSSETIEPGTVATYTCDNGYELLGPPRRTCAENGTWVPSGVPFCGKWYVSISLFLIFFSLHQIPLLGSEVRV